MEPEEVIEEFKQTGALLEGHFQLTSGLHSNVYLQCARVLQFPEGVQWRDGSRVDLLVTIAASFGIGNALSASGAALCRPKEKLLDLLYERNGQTLGELLPADTRGLDQVAPAQQYVGRVRWLHVQAQLAAGAGGDRVDADP